ncbi:hypothetical protein I4U23_028475 [Adineta vaga]|nr:hypothetical protein I4U23_028475 [Adineta vaga]
MTHIWIFICFLLIKLSLSLSITINRQQRINEITNNQHLSVNICSMESINIDTLSNGSDSHPDKHDDNTSTTILANDIIHFKSSWQQQQASADDQEQNDHSSVLNTIQIIFTIPYIILNNSILNNTVFITDIVHNELLASLTNICIDNSSFIVHYSTMKPLPHNICLYLLLNLTSSTILREIFFCRTIDSLSNITSSNDSETEVHRAVGPSSFFILSQCVIILIMMIIIYGVQTARQKSLVNRVGQRLIRSRPYMIVFGNKTNGTAAIDTTNIPRNTTTTPQTGLNHLLFHRNLTVKPNFKMIEPIEEQVLAANDLTSTMQDRRASKVYINRDLINVKEFTKRMSTTNESSTDNELHVLNTNY